MATFAQSAQIGAQKSLLQCWYKKNKGLEGKITLTAINIGVRRPTMVRKHPTPNLRVNIAKVKKAVPHK